MLILLLQIGVLLAVAVALGWLAARLGLPAIVGEIMAGVLLGPSLLGRLAPGFSKWLLPRQPDQMHLLGAVAEIGVLLLVAITGAHIDLDLICRKRREIALVSSGSVLLPLALGFVLGFVLPASLIGGHANRVAFSLFIGVAVAVSALPVIAKTLLDMGLIHRNVGQLIIGSAAVSDIIGWLLLSMVSAMVTRGLRIGVVLESVGYLGVVLAAVVLARLLIKRALRSSGGSAERKLSLSAIVVMTMLFAAATQALSMEPILGAFLCGVLIGSLSSNYRRTLDSMRSFVMASLVPIYLAMAGLQVDLATLFNPTGLAAGVLTLLVAIGAKFVGGYLGARAGRLDHIEALAIGAGLNARGVVEIVLASVGLQLGILTGASYTIIVLVAVITSVMAPPVLRRTMGRSVSTVAEVEREREFSVQI
jgi:Kef-type K+ transport system membrane component KefB